MPVDYRRDPFDDSDQSVLISDEAQTVPASSPYYVWLDEIPREDDPSSLSVQEVAASTDIQPDAAGKDAYIYEDIPGTNYNSGILAVGREGGPTYGRYRSLVQFDLTSLGASVESALVRLYREAGASDTEQQIGVHRITSAWTETGVTYGTAPTYDVVAEDVVGVTTAGYYEWDITDLVNAWLDATFVNHGVMFVHADESSTDTSRNFTSSDGASNRPMLRATLTGQTFTLVARTATPGPGEVAVSYPRGALKFNAADANTDVLVTYYGTGSPIRAADV